MTHWGDGTSTHSGVEDRVMLELQTWGVDHVTVFANEFHDGFNGFFGVVQATKRQRNGLVDDLH